jgi:hypothetical protein
MYDFRLDVKTIEESDRSGTDPEDESQSMADIQNVGDYEAIFQPSRKRTCKCICMDDCNIATRVNVTQHDEQY